MFKKNKISVFLVAMVMLLSVYYLNVPENPSSPSDPSDSGEVQEDIKDERLVASRLQITNYRNEVKRDLSIILGNSSISIEEKNKALETISSIEKYSSKELILEMEILTSLNISNSLVHVIDDEVSITVVTVADGTPELTNSLFSMAKLEFGAHYVISLNYLLPL